jgi:hypothetical protein
MQEAAEDLATLEGIQRGLEQRLRSEGRPAAEFFVEFREQHGIISQKNDEGISTVSSS